MPPFPNIWRKGCGFNLDLSHTDLNINRDHLLMEDYLPTKFDASWEKSSWVISCTRCRRPTRPLTFDLLTWISIGIIYSSRIIYLSRSKVKVKVTAWCQLKWLVTRIMHAKYQCSIINTSEDMSQVKVFVTDGQTGGWTDEWVVMSPAFAKGRGQ